MALLFIFSFVNFNFIFLETYAISFHGSVLAVQLPFLLLIYIHARPSIHIHYPSEGVSNLRLKCGTHDSL